MLKVVQPTVLAWHAMHSRTGACITPGSAHGRDTPDRQGAIVLCGQSHTEGVVASHQSVGRHYNAASGYSREGRHAPGAEVVQGNGGLTGKAPL